MATHNKVRKQFLLDPEKLRLAKKALKAKTDTETVERALKLAIGNEAMAEAHRQLFASEGTILDVFGRLGPIEG